jgi:hypothetical protein
MSSLFSDIAPSIARDLNTPTAPSRKPTVDVYRGILNLGMVLVNSSDESSFWWLKHPGWNDTWTFADVTIVSLQSIASFHMFTHIDHLSVIPLSLRRLFTSLSFNYIDT